MAPRLPGLTIPGDATDAQKMTVLLWAKDWCGYADKVTAAWMPGLDNMLVGKRAKSVNGGDIKEERRVMEMAIHALRQAAFYNRAMRTAGAFPFVEFRLGPQEYPCERAQEMQNQLIPCVDFPTIPLPGCTSATCSCWVRQVTKSEVKKRVL